jgi:cytochrome c oxidase subunit 2
LRKHLIGIIGLGLLAVGLVGLLVVGSVGVQGGLLGQFRSNGERIYFTGVGRSGPIPRVGGAMMSAGGGCVSCHGPTGRGGRIGVMMGGIISVPDIRYSKLTSAHTEEEAMPAWTNGDIARAVREGVEPNGESMNSYMPRWKMTDADMRDLIGYLKELK